MLAREEAHRQRQPNTKDTAVTVQLCKPATPGGNSDAESQTAIARVEQKNKLRKLQSVEVTGAPCKCGFDSQSPGREKERSGGLRL